MLDYAEVLLIGKAHKVQKKKIAQLKVATGADRTYLQKSRYIEDAICHDIDYFDPGFKQRQSELQGLRNLLKKNQK